MPYDERNDVQYDDRPDFLKEIMGQCFWFYGFLFAFALQQASLAAANQVLQNGWQRWIVVLRLVFVLFVIAGWFLGWTRFNYRLLHKCKEYQDEYDNLAKPDKCQKQIDRTEQEVEAGDKDGNRRSEDLSCPIGRPQTEIDSPQNKLDEERRQARANFLATSFSALLFIFWGRTIDSKDVIPLWGVKWSFFLAWYFPITLFDLVWGLVLRRLVPGNKLWESTTFCNWVGVNLFCFLVHAVFIILFNFVDRFRYFESQVLFDIGESTFIVFLVAVVYWHDLKQYIENKLAFLWIWRGPGKCIDWVIKMEKALKRRRLYGDSDEAKQQSAGKSNKIPA